jgi:hypothetical protein
MTHPLEFHGMSERAKKDQFVRLLRWFGTIDLSRAQVARWQPSKAPAGVAAS